MINSFYIKMASIVFNWRYLAVVTSTGQIAMRFMEEFEKGLTTERACLSLAL
jgi:hypothetical protein